MAKLLNFSIDLTKIPEDKISKTNKEGKPFKNGGMFVNLTAFINDTPDEYGNNVKVVISQSSSEREEKKPYHYIGDGKTLKK